MNGVFKTGCALAVALGVGVPVAQAACTVTPYIVVDGQSCDWTATEKPLVYAGAGSGSATFSSAELTDDYLTTSTGDGDLYGLMQFPTGTTFAVNDQVGVFLDIDGGPAIDTACGGNYDLTFTCTTSPCTTSTNWTANFYSKLSGTACQQAASGITLTTSGTSEQAAFAISGTTIEFGVTFAAIGLSTTFVARPYSTTNASTNANLNMLASQAYSTTTVGPTSVTLTDLGARSDASGVTVGWVARGERGNLGFILYRSRDHGPPQRVSAQLGRIHAFEDWAYRARDPSGRAGDRYFVADVDQHTGRERPHGPAVASATAALPAQPATSRQARREERRIAPRPAGPLATEARLGVSAEGMYLVTDADLQAAGVQPPVAASLSRLGQAVGASSVTRGRIFYAGPIQNGYDGVDAYVLRAGTGATAPARVPIPGPGSRLVATVSSHAHLKADLAYDWDAATDDPYVWAWASNLYPLDPVTFDAPAAASFGAGGQLTVHLLGGTLQAHHVAVLVNGQSLGSVRWTGLSAQDATVDLPAGLLKPAGNTLAIEAIFDTGAALEFALLESADLDYPRLPHAAAGEARFSLPSGACVSAGGFGSGAQAWDVTLSLAAQPLRVAARAGQLAFCAPQNGVVHRYEVFDDSALKAASIRPYAPGTLASAAPADEVLVVAPGLERAVAPLIAARQAQGLRVLATSPSQIDDAFGFGESGRWPLRAFFDHAIRSWPAPPHYALLVGGANSDVRDVLGTGIPDLIPTGVTIAGPDQMRAASDSWYVASGDGFTPLIAIGRLPVDSASELDAVVAKTLKGDGQGARTGNAVFTVDVQEEPDDADFAVNSAVVAALAQAAGFNLTQVSAADASPAGEIASAFASGVDLLHYVGHAGTSQWGGNDFLSSELLSTFQNQRLPLLTSYDCLDGAFDNPTTTALGWAALAAPAGGVLAAFVPSAVLSPREAHVFDLLVTQALLAPTGGKLGDALLSALQAASSESALADEVRAYNLLGDPASPVPLR